MKLCLICKMLVRCSNCEMGYVHESITHVDIGLGTNCNAGGLFHSSQSVGQPIDGKSTGRHHDSAGHPGATDATGLTVTVANVANVVVHSRGVTEREPALGVHGEGRSLDHPYP